MGYFLDELENSWLFSTWAENFLYDRGDWDLDVESVYVGFNLSFAPY